MLMDIPHKNYGFTLMSFLQRLDWARGWGFRVVAFEVRKVSHLTRKQLFAISLHSGNLSESSRTAAQMTKDLDVRG